MKRILIVLLSVLALAGLAACSTPSPTDSVNTFLTAVKAGDAESIKKVYSAEDFDLLGLVSEETDISDTDTTEVSDFEVTFQQKLMDFDYTISNEQINGDKATVDVEFKTYAFGDALSSWMTELMSQIFVLAFSGMTEDQMNTYTEQLLITKIDELQEKTYTKTVTLHLTKSDDTWVLEEVNQVALVNAMTGGLLDAGEAMENLFSFAE